MTIHLLCGKKPGFLSSLCIVAVAILLLPALEADAVQPKKIIYETDMCLDVDDVGGLAMLHAMADRGEVEILAVTFNEVHKSGAAAIDAINTWYKRGDIPVGIYKKPLHKPDGSKYLDSVAEFPHDLTRKTAPSALDVYKQVLARQPDHSVTIISVGFLNNLHDLLKAAPELVAKKVAELVVMGGLMNDGFNLVRHNLVGQSEFVIRNWPGRLTISQFGQKTHTGAALKGTPETNPVRNAYFRWFNRSFKGRSSWDQVAVLYAVRGLSLYFKENTRGKGRLSNGFEWPLKTGFRSYLDVKIPNRDMEKIIEDLMIAPPGSPTATSAGSSSASAFGATAVQQIKSCLSLVILQAAPQGRLTVATGASPWNSDAILQGAPQGRLRLNRPCGALFCVTTLHHGLAPVATVKHP